MGFSLVSDEDGAFTPLYEWDQCARLRDLRRFVDKHSVEVDISQHAQPCSRARCEDDTSLLHSLHRLLDEPWVVRDAAAQPGVNGESLESLVNL